MAVFIPKKEMKRGVVLEHINKGYTRFEILLPYRTQGEVAAAHKVIEYIKTARKQKGHRYEGLTHSTTGQPAFIGWWRNPNTNKWDSDALILLILDLEIVYSDTKKIEKEATRLKNAINNRYNKFNAHQDLIWMVVYPISLSETPPLIIKP